MRVEFQWFLMALSVRPTNVLAISAHLLPNCAVGEDQLAVLVAAPLLALDLGVEVVVPALAALLADAARELLRNLGPLLSAQLADELDDLGILLRRPRAFDELGVENLLPAVQALDVRALLEVLGCWMEVSRGGGGG